MNSNQTDCEKLHLDPGILQKARDGHSIAQVTLGKAYFNAVYLENNCLHVFEWFTRSAEHGNMEAQFLLANLYALGQGTKQSHVDAYKWYFKAALQGYKKALIRIHNLYQQDKKLHCRGKLNSEEEHRIKEYDPFDPEYYYRELNEQRLEDYRLKFNGTVIDYVEEFNKYKSYDCDDPDTQLKLAFFYQYGYGVKKSILLAFKFYEKAAEKGHRDAQYHLAVLYQQNTNIKFNYRKALRWYRASATNGNIAAQNNLAYFYEKGLSIEINYEGAIYWYTKAAYSGNSDAQLNLGRLYRKGQGVEQNFLEAAKWYKLAALQGNIAAQNCLNQLFQNRKLNYHSNTETLPERGDESFSPATTLRSKLQNDINRLSCSPKIKILTKLSQHALMTDGNAMYTIGLKYYNGEDFPQDKDTGFQWINRAAKAGNQKAEMKIAKMYEGGDTVEQDYHESSIWAKKLVKKRIAEAQYSLGNLYKNGLGVRKDPLEASKWFLKSGDQGNRDALYQFGLLRFDGEGVRKDRKEAFEYFYRSAHLGKLDALFRLGYMYENGDSVEKDESKAVKMYESAARLGYIHAQFRLGRIYEEGDLIQKDLVKALKYYTMTANSGDPPYLNELAIKHLNGVFGDPNITKVYDLLQQTSNKDNLIGGAIFKRPIIHFTKIDDISKIIDMLIAATKLGVEHIAYEIGYAYEFGLKYGKKYVSYDNHTNTTRLYCYYSIIEHREIEIDQINLDRIQFIEHMKALEWYKSGNEKLIYDDYSSKIRAYGREFFDSHKDRLYSNYTNAIKWYSTAASKEDPRAYYRLGAIYDAGKGVNKNLKTAFNYYSLAYKNENSNAAYSLALMYLNGNGISQDLIKAFYLFSEASCMGCTDANEMLIPSKSRDNLEMLEAVAILGHVAVQYQLGVFYEEENDIKSFKWISLAAQGGITDAYYKLGLFYEEGRGTDIDYSIAVDLYEKAGKKDHPGALYRLAQLYHHGKAVKCDHIRGYDFYTRVAKLEHKGAQKILDINERLIMHSYENNQEVTFSVSSKEIKDSLLLLRSVAKHGNVELQYSLGVFYYSDGDSPDYEEAFSWFKMAADNGHIEAIFHLGLLYENGLGVEQDYSKSFDLFHRASEQGSHYGIYRLGVAFHHGYGVDRSIEDALSCYIKAAELGNHESQYTLGLLYKGGLVQEDTMKALEWFTNAYHNVNLNAIDDLFDLYIDQPYEHYFHQRLFQVLSKFEKAYKSDNYNYHDTYGIMYSKLGKMYFYGLGTAKDYPKSVSHFIKAYNYGDYSSAIQYLPLEYKDSSFELQNNYMEMLQAYSAVTDQLDGYQLYKLGMLYQDGAEIYSVDQNTANISGPVAIVQKDEVKAFHYIQLASRKGHPGAQYRLGQRYLEGNVIQQDYNEAIKWLKRSTESMHPAYCYQQGMKYFEGDIVERNFKISLIFIKAAAKENHAGAQAQLTMMSLQNNGIEKKQQDVIKEIQDAVEPMDPYDCYRLGMEFYNGTRVDKNYEISSIYLRKAADNNHAEAQAQLGSMYYQGHGVEKDKEEAKKLIEKSLVEMTPEECYDKGMKFYEGTEVEINYEIALLYLRKSAEKHYALALAQLGLMYFQGDGAEKNFGEAIKYTEQAIIEMTPGECYNQGMKFYSGFEVDTNYELAIKYLKRAATKNHPKAQAQMDLMYLQGHGVGKSRAEVMSCIKHSVKAMEHYDCYQQGMEFYKNTEVDKDYGISLIYIRKAAKDSSIKCVQRLAQEQLGLMHLRGDGVEKNYEKAMDLIKRSVNNMWIGHYYFKGMEFYRATDVDRNYEISLIYLKEGAKKGDPYSQAQLAYMYSKGIGVNEVLEQANKWRNRIKNGYPKHDTISLAQIYHYDEDGIQDLSKALEYYQKKLYGLEEDRALRGIRLLHEYGDGVNQDRALRGIGLLYEYGDGVNQDYQKAMEFYKKSAKYNNMGAYYNLGLLYYYGRGVDKSYSDALSWFKEIVRNNTRDDENHVFIRDDSNDILNFVRYTGKKYSFQPTSIFFGAAHYYLGLMHRNGHGTVQNKDRAQAHFSKSLGYGIQRANDFILQ